MNLLARKSIWALILVIVLVGGQEAARNFASASADSTAPAMPPDFAAKLGPNLVVLDNEGKLQMIFIIGVAKRLDADHIDMANMEVETFDEQQQHEMYIDLPTSILNLNTSIISTQKHVTIRREDFVLTGETMEFNTKTKQGTLGGSVKMLIYNLDNQTPKPDSETPTPPPTAASEPSQPASVSKAP